MSEADPGVMTDTPAGIFAFAQRYRLRIKRDEDRTRILLGRYGHLWEDGDRLAVTIFGERATVGVWNNRRRACEAVRMELVQDGDAEGTLKFDPSNVEQAQAAIRAVGAYHRKRLSPEQAAAGAARLARWRSKQQTAMGGQNRRSPPG